MPGGTRRVFFALWPDPDIRRAIIERRRAIDGLSRRRVPDANLHATLLFLGDQSGALVDRLREAPGVESVAPFTLRLERFGWFARARVAWLGGPPVPPGRALVRWLAGRAESHGIGVDRQRWVPHVTLFRKVQRRPTLPEPPPLDWPINAYSLVESIANRPYQVLRTWSLE